MKRNTFVSLFISFVSLFIFSNVDGQNGWKAGTACMDITPDQLIWMAGYGSRDHVAEGILTTLNAKALALEDEKDNKVVLITADLLGFPKNVSDRIRQRVAKSYDLQRNQFILSASHTHTGPVLTDALTDMYPFDEKQTGEIQKYTDELVDKLVDLTGEALKSMTPARLFAGNGITRFQVNRRNNAEKTLNALTELKGPNDYSVPVLKITDESGNVKAVLFGYACHATVLSTYQYSGDYPGFAQLEIERMHPGTVAMFFQGAGADQNPLPRRTIALAKQYGSELAAAVERVLNENMKKLEPFLSTAYSESDLPFSTPPDQEELVKIANGSGTFSDKKWAANQLRQLHERGILRRSYPYPLVVWKLGEQPLMILGGEVVVQYALELKKLYGPDIFVMSYANDDMAYIPSETILQEGGYEGESSQRVYGLPSKWNAGIQSRILNEVQKMAKKAGVKQLSEF